MSFPIGPVASRRGCCKLLTLNRHWVQQWLNTFDTILYDADGVLWNHDKHLKGVPDTFNALRALGKKSFICTNNSTKSARDIWRKAQRMGLLVSEHEVLTSAKAVAKHLQQRKFNKKVYIVGEQGIADELAAVDIKYVPLDSDRLDNAGSMLDYAKAMQLDGAVGAVVVGMDKDFNARKLVKAATYLKKDNVLFLATNRDVAFPLANGRVLPSAGAMVSSIKAASKRTPLTCGKPNPLMCAHLIRSGIIKPQRTLMVGDTMQTDIQFGYNCGFQTLLVGTGVSNMRSVEQAQSAKQPHMYQQVPDLFLPKLSDLLKFLSSRNC